MTDNNHIFIYIISCINYLTILTCIDALVTMNEKDFKGQNVGIKQK